MIDIVEVEIFLRETITGVIALGAFGSLLGVLLLYLMKKAWAKFYASREFLLVKLFYTPIGRPIELGRKIEKTYGPKEASNKYIVYHIDSSLSSLAATITFLFSLTLTAHVVIAYGIEKSTLLSLLIAINFYTSFIALKLGLKVNSHVNEDFENDIKKIDTDMPKKAKDWLEARHENPNKAIKSDS